MSHHLFYTAAILLILVVVCYSDSKQNGQQKSKHDKSAFDARKPHQHNSTNGMVKKLNKNGLGRRNSTELATAKSGTVKRSVTDRLSKMNDDGKFDKRTANNATAAAEKFRKGSEQRKGNFQKQNATMAKGNFRNLNTTNLQQLQHNKGKETPFARNDKRHSTLKLSTTSRPKRSF
uniref:Small acidic protein-like domain-containing protein n=1 Tax=Syphacia muris TaxID=451379 RepID=A0A0N5AYL2_9BILA